MAHLLERRHQARKEERQPGGTERVLVCLSSRAPQPQVLLRRGARLADRLHAPWYVVYVETPNERVDRIDAATQRQISDILALARRLGGIAMPYKAEDFAAGVAAFVQEYAITHVVMGRSQRPWYRRLFGQSPLERLLQKVRGVDVLIVDTE
jgi:two-component system sensor histidine kinase KdpD